MRVLNIAKLAKYMKTGPLFAVLVERSERQRSVRGHAYGKDPQTAAPDHCLSSAEFKHLSASDELP